MNRILGVQQTVDHQFLPVIPVQLKIGLTGEGEEQAEHDENPGYSPN